MAVVRYQQRTPYTCSAAVLHAVLRHWGRVIDEDTLVDVIGVKPIFGASPRRIVKAARKLGYSAEEQYFSSFEELQALIGSNVPVIAKIKSFNYPNDYHYVVVTRVDGDLVAFMDPNVDGNYRELTYAEMWHRWGPERLGIIVVPKALGAVDYRNRWLWAGVAGALALAGLIWAKVHRIS